MPPQQPDRLLDLIDRCLNFRAHGPVRSLSRAYLAIRTAFIKPLPQLKAPQSLPRKSHPAQRSQSASAASNTRSPYAPLLREMMAADPSANFTRISSRDSARSASALCRASSLSAERPNRNTPGATLIESPASALPLLPSTSFIRILPSPAMLSMGAPRRSENLNSSR